MIYLMEDSALSDMTQRLKIAMANPESIGPFTRTNEPARPEKPYKIENRTARMELTGVMSSRRSWLMQLFGYAPSMTYGEFVDALDQAESDDEVDQIAIFMDTPGGEAAGVDDAAVMLAATSKPTTVYAGSQVLSAGYYIASQADKIIGKPASVFGSIGTAVAMLNDPEVVQIASSDAPRKRPDVSTVEGRRIVQEQLDEMQALFVQRVATGRGVTEDTVRAQFGQGGYFRAENALQRGMIDAIEQPAGRTEQATGETEPTEQRTQAPVATNRQSNNENRGNHSKTINGSRKKMNLEELKQQFPETFQAAVAEGVNQERKRVEMLNAWAEADPDNGKVREIVQSAIASGETVEKIEPKLHVAMRDHGKTRQETDSPKQIGTENGDLGGGQEEPVSGEQYGAELKERLKKAGVM